MVDKRKMGLTVSVMYWPLLLTVVTVNIFCWRMCRYIVFYCIHSALHVRPQHDICRWLNRSMANDCLQFSLGEGKTFCGNVNKIVLSNIIIKALLIDRWKLLLDFHTIVVQVMFSIDFDNFYFEVAVHWEIPCLIRRPVINVLPEEVKKQTILHRFSEIFFLYRYCD